MCLVVVGDERALNPRRPRAEQIICLDGAIKIDRVCLLATNYSKTLVCVVLDTEDRRGNEEGSSRPLAVASLLLCYSYYTLLLLVGMRKNARRNEIDEKDCRYDSVGVLQYLLVIIMMSSC